MKTHILYDGWYTFDQKFVSFDEVSHQHISNAIWFSEVFNNRTKSNDKFMEQADWVLTKRFDGVRLPWKPLPIPKEIETLKQMGLITKKGYILGNSNTPSFNGKVIGSINHINNKTNDKQELKK